MPKTVQIRNIDDGVYAALVRQAADAGISVPDLLRREANRIAARPSLGEWLERTRRRTTEITPIEVLDAIDRGRGSWRDAGG